MVENLSKDQIKAFLASKKCQLFLSTRQAKVKEVLEASSLLKRNKGLNILSIGAGDGTTDQCIIKGNQLEVALYYAIEPILSGFNASLEEKVKSWNIPYFIENVSFSEDYNLPRKDEVNVNHPDGSTKPLCKFVNSNENSGHNGGIFDLVIMSSVLYHMDHPGLAVKKARSLLRPGGRIVIFIQSFEISSEVFSLNSGGDVSIM